MAKDRAEVASDGISHLLKSRHGMNRGIDFVLHAGYRAIRNSAWHDQVEVAQVGGHVQRKSMRGNATRDMHADCGDLLLRDGPSGQRPDSGAFRNSLGDNAIAGTGANEDFLQLANIVDSAETRSKAAQIDDRITDQLTRAMIGDVPAAVDLVDFHSSASEQFVASQDVLSLRISAEGEDWRMFEQQQSIADALLMTQLDELPLESQASA